MPGGEFQALFKNKLDYNKIAVNPDYVKIIERAGFPATIYANPTLPKDILNSIFKLVVIIKLKEDELNSLYNRSANRHYKFRIALYVAGVAIFLALVFMSLGLFCAFKA